MGILEKVFYILISLAVSLVFYFEKIGLKHLNNINDILSGTLAFNSIGIGFLVAAIIMIPSLSDNYFFKKLEELGTDMKLLKIMAIEIRILLFSSILALVLLFLINDLLVSKYNNLINNLILYIWVFITVLSLLYINKVVALFLKVLKHIQANKKE